MSGFNKNIVLVGMMGSGKTTIGRLISEKLKMNFVDMDEYIEKAAGSTIRNIFEKGEEYFRALESEAVLEISKLNSAVISTGGGVVKKSANMDLLKKNGIIFFIDRPIMNIAADIEAEGRPLLNSGEEVIFEIIKDRYKLYENCCDVIIKNEKDIGTAAEKIIESYIAICRGGEQHENFSY